MQGKIILFLPLSYNYQYFVYIFPIFGHTHFHKIIIVMPAINQVFPPLLHIFYKSYLL